MSKILVINNGSTSFRFKVLNSDDFSIAASGAIENMNKEDSYLKYSTENVCIKKDIKVTSFYDAINIMNDLLMDNNVGIIKHKEEIDSIGYRVIHGGEVFTESVVIDNAVFNKIKDLSELMPLHANNIINSIECCTDKFNSSLPVAVFDTAFHSTIPKENYLYSLPKEYYEKYGIRKYGFHGISYNSVLKKYINLANVDRDSYSGIICHLGGGSSICAIKDGMSYDTTMEFTPSSGMVMASRVGNIDPMALFYIMNKEHLSTEDIISIINSKSGYKALCDDTDMKSIVTRGENGDIDALLTRKIIENDFKKNLLSMMANLNHIDSIILTGGIGTKNAEQREMLLQNLFNFGIALDKSKNEKCFNQDMLISAIESRIPIYVITDDEEKEIASECMKLIKRRSNEKQ